MEDKVVRKSIIWAFGSEIGAKLIVPITNMILARILIPEDFGVVAIATMVISLVDLLSDSGVSKFIIHYDYNDDDDFKMYTNIAFWTNICISIFLVFSIFIWQKQIGILLGDANYGKAIAISSIQILITAFSSIQTAVLRRKFKFNILFYSRMITVLIPLISTIPLAFIYKSYWALIFGNLITSLVNVLALMKMSGWRPEFKFDFNRLKNMVSYSSWALGESLTSWIILWIDTLIIGNIFNNHLLGLYKNSASMVNSLIGIFSFALAPVIFSTLSRLKDDEYEFNRVFLGIQRLILFLLVPITIGLFMYRNTVTLLMFGSKWLEASDIVGIWSILVSTNVIFYSITAELYKSKGIPKILFITQIIYLIILIPFLSISSKFGFWNMVYLRPIPSIIQAIINIFVIYNYFRIKPLEMIRGYFVPILFCIPIVIIYFLIPNSDNILMINVFKIAASVLVYLLEMYLFAKDEVKKLLEFINK